jgi:hypothetical protein
LSASRWRCSAAPLSFGYVKCSPAQ